MAELAGFKNQVHFSASLPLIIGFTTHRTGTRLDPEPAKLALLAAALEQLSAATFTEIAYLQTVTSVLVHFALGHRACMSLPHSVYRMQQFLSAWSGYSWGVALLPMC